MPSTALRLSDERKMHKTLIYPRYTLDKTSIYPRLSRTFWGFLGDFGVAGFCRIASDVMDDVREKRHNRLREVNRLAIVVELGVWRG